MILATTK